MSANENSEKFLSRWSKRKLDSAQEAKNQEAQVHTESDNSAHLAQLEANRQAAEAIDIDSLDKDSDFSVFLKEGVPESLKKRALAVLWRSNPILANVDGLVDYGDDFGNPALNMETFQSAYEIGKGYLKKLEKLSGESVDAENLTDNEAAPNQTENVDAPSQETSESPSESDNDQKIEVGMESDSQIPESEPNEAQRNLKVSLRRRLELDE